MRRFACAALALLLWATIPWPAAPAAAAPGDPAPPYYINTTAIIETNFGTIVVMLYDFGAPITVANWVNLSASGFYDGLLFHRIVDNFVIQTGDPNTRDNNPYNDGMGGSSQTIPLEVSENLTHVDGALGMARASDPNSASSQFYICDGEQHQLDGNYAVFGVVIEGMDVVRTIASQPVWGNKRPLLAQHPIDDIVMEKVTVSYGYQGEPPAGKGGGVLGGFLSSFAPDAVTGAEVGSSIAAVVAVGAVALIAIAGLRRGLRNALDTYRSDVLRVGRASRRLATRVAHGVTGVLPLRRRA